ncbi:hypothetical protein [Bacillus subtilis]|uniref:hypothetical protein n=1 Tax=Bacillus subtilis TaxID=1423 RepID=UPI0004A58B32|nr:hypothetical protein [Bacillus subtilis]WJF86838.1 hypothetical protein QSU94_20920 [Bacillus subtilis]CCU56850.1 hypothetical protein BSUBE1_0219 [Bacillus subtilis E1]
MEAKKRIKRVAVYLRKSRNNEGEETEETLAKHRKRLLDIAEKTTGRANYFKKSEVQWMKIDQSIKK